MSSQPDPRSVWFLTGTRADFGKLKPLIEVALEVPDVRVRVIVTGMHLLERYGNTVREVRRLPMAVEIVEFANQTEPTTMDRVLAETISRLASLIDGGAPDLLVVHGDRLEALAGASVGALRNVAVAHVEGGEVSGTVDGILRHAVSKLATVHLVANDEAARRVAQMGEAPERVFVIGSPDVDVMLSDRVPDVGMVLTDYEIPFSDYVVVILHGVTTEPLSASRECARAVVDVLSRSGQNVVVIYPNNDPGSAEILGELERLRACDRVRMLPSMRFEAFLSLLRNARCILGNSSAGIREAPIYGVPSVNIGSRQRGRHLGDTIIDADPSEVSIRSALELALASTRAEPSLHFGVGQSSRRFAELLGSGRLWDLQPDKVFLDLADRRS